MSNIYSLSVKEINNRPTQICRKDELSMFMSKTNQINVTKQIYLLHKSNHGVLGYLHFKMNVPNRMYFWISNKNLNNDPNVDKFIDIVAFLNKMFIKDNSDLYEFKSAENDDLLDKNVYKSQAMFGLHLDDGSIISYSKDYQNLTAEDIRNLDVWTPQTVEVSNINKRYKNEVPVWQKSMNTRNYSRDNEGLRTTSNRASLNTIISGYGDDMKLIRKLKEAQSKKYKS